MDLNLRTVGAYIQLAILEFGKLAPAPLELTARQRRVMGSKIMRYAHDFVGRVGRGMRAHPHLFASYPVTAEALLARQARARCWRALTDCFLHLTEWANDLYLHEQSTAVDEAMSVLRQIEAEEEMPFGPDKDTRWRRIALTAAFLFIEKRKKKAQQAGRRGGQAGRGKRKKTS
jgi:hypothetical protein